MKKYIDSKLIYYLCIVDFLIIIIAILWQLIGDAKIADSSVGGWIIIIAPIIVAIYSFPMVINNLLSFFNKEKEKRILDVFIIILSLVSIVTNLSLIRGHLANLVLTIISTAMGIIIAILTIIKIIKKPH